MKRDEKIKHTFIISALIFCFLFLFVFLTWWVYPYRTSVQKQPYEVINKEVKPWELLKYRMEYCKYTDVIPSVQRQFVDWIIYSMPESTASLKKWCGTVINSVIVPNSLPEWEYYLRALVHFKVNPIRVITEEYVTEKFRVVNK